jgi:hypothetical protein
MRAVLDSKPATRMTITLATADEMTFQKKVIAISSQWVC